MGLVKITLPFFVSLLFWLLLFCGILRQCDQYLNSYTLFFSIHILRISFFWSRKKTKQDTYEIKSFRIYILKRYTYLEKLSFKVLLHFDSYHLTFGADKSLRALCPEIWNHVPKTLEAEISFQVLKMSLSNWPGSNGKFKVRCHLDNYSYNTAML